MELIAELEKEKRGVYAGAVGYFGYGSVDSEGEIEGAMDVSNCCNLNALQSMQIINANLHRRASRSGPWWSKTESLICKQG
jgi:hypothetical protein